MLRSEGALPSSSPKRYSLGCFEGAGPGRESEEGAVQVFSWYQQPGFLFPGY